jgi:CDP-diacylglycerol---serine O-phosphatidyltransferase
MSKRTSSTANGGAGKDAIASEPGEFELLRACISIWLIVAMDKQKTLLSSDTGHFSLIKALHLADLITELNGKSSAPPLIVSFIAAAEKSRLKMIC